MNAELSQWVISAVLLAAAVAFYWSLIREYRADKKKILRNVGDDQKWAPKQYYGPDRFINVQETPGGIRIAVNGFDRDDIPEVDKDGLAVRVKLEKIDAMWREVRGYMPSHPRFAGRLTAEDKEAIATLGDGAIRVIIWPTLTFMNAEIGYVPSHHAGDVLYATVWYAEGSKNRETYNWVGLLYYEMEQYCLRKVGREDLLNS